MEMPTHGLWNRSEFSGKNANDDGIESGTAYFSGLLFLTFFFKEKILLTVKEGKKS